MRFGSVCSGIEAASVAWHPLQWRAAWLAEIEPFPSAVLAHHYPEVPNLGDMTALPDRIRSGEVEAPDLFCGGTPCQAFSVAGLRRSLDDARGNLSLTFCEIADAIDAVRLARGELPAVVFWENVPGVLSTADNAFGCFLAGLAGDDQPAVPPRGKWKAAGVVVGPERLAAWRVLDAQFFGVAQRRRRVFVVSVSLRHPRAWAIAESILPVLEGVQRDPPARGKTGKVAPTIPSRSTAGGGLGTDFDCDGGVVPQPYAVGNTLTARMHKGINTTLDEGQTPVLAHALRGEGFDASEDGTGRGTLLVPVAFAETAPTLSVGAHGSAGHPHRQHGNETAVVGMAHAFGARQSDVLQYGDKTGPLDTRGNSINVAVDLYNQTITGDVACSLTTTGGGPLSGPSVMQPVGVFQDSEFGVQQYDSAGTLRAGRIPEHQMVMQPVAFDTTQITHPENRSNPKPGDPCHPLAAGAHAPAVAFQPRIARNGRGNMGDVVNALQAQSGQTGKGDAAPCVATAMQVRRLTPVECSRLQGFPDDYLELIYADADEAHAAQILHELWKQVGASAFEKQEWGTGISAALLTPEILLAGVYGGWIPWQMAAECAAASRSIQSQNACSEEFVRALRSAGASGCSPYQRQSFGQLAHELGSDMSILPLERAQARKALRSNKLWPQAQEKWPLRYAFAAPEKRDRLDRLNPDGPRYKALGNSWAVPVVRWIGRRIHDAVQGTNPD